MPRKIVVPSAEKVATKWAGVTPGRSTYYLENTPGASAKFEANAIKAGPTFQTAIQSADMVKKFVGGLRGKAAKFARKVTDVGAPRFGPGVTAAQPDMQSGVDPYLGVMGVTEIPDRGPRGSSANYGIVEKVGDPLHKKRLALLGATVSA